MDEHAGAGAEFAPDDEDFTVSQDTEFDEPDEVHGDEDRPLDEAGDEPPGVDAERRVDLGDERSAAADDGE
ncbi:hypothetical protein ACFVTX_12885 [Agromyces sp. NPDC058136]|uniref:hypothetical protein n=1 Tax=Agromyces sp. NPDC058136 TaxID=3346354 RepID=UPI0036DA6E60